MSIENYNQAIELIRDYESKIDLEESLLEPQALENIEQAEKILNLKFPASYKKFLQECGNLFLGGESIYGLTTNADFRRFDYSNIVCSTLNLRWNQVWPGFRDYLIPIYGYEENDRLFLDCSRMNDQDECPVVEQYVDNEAKQIRERIIAEDFGAFLLEKVQFALDYIQNRDLDVESSTQDRWELYYEFEKIIPKKSDLVIKKFLEKFTPEDFITLPIVGDLISYKKIDIMKWLHNKNIPLAHQDCNPLLGACGAGGNLELVKFFIENDIATDIHKKGERFGDTALTLAIYYRHYDIVEYFKEKFSIDGISFEDLDVILYHILSDHQGIISRGNIMRYEKFGK